MLREQDAGMRVLSDEERAASLNALLAAVDCSAGAWVFAYGSLIWNPAFECVEQRGGHIHGFHRRFCLWTHLGRGTPDRPGLVLGLERGGSCRGVAFRIASECVACELDVIWRREMVSGAYRPRWLPVRTDAGTVQAIAFVINPDHDRYAGVLPDDQVVEAIAHAEGRIGPCCDYLFNTVDHLDRLGIHDRGLKRMRDAVTHRRAALIRPSQP